MFNNFDFSALFGGHGLTPPSTISAPQLVNIQAPMPTMPQPMMQAPSAPAIEPPKPAKDSLFGQAFSRLAGHPVADQDPRHQALAQGLLGMGTSMLAHPGTSMLGGLGGGLQAGLGAYQGSMHASQQQSQQAAQQAAIQRILAMYGGQIR